MIKWFAGLVDGEGCFTYHIYQRGIKQVSIRPLFTIAMTPGLWEPVVTSILNSHNIKYNLRTHNYLSEIRVNGIKQIKPLCELILPYSIIKKPIIERMVNFEGKMQWNQYKCANSNDIKRLANDVDFARSFNRKRNVPYIWDGNKICDIYGILR